MNISTIHFLFQYREDVWKKDPGDRDMVELDLNTQGITLCSRVRSYPRDCLFQFHAVFLSGILA
jgi:hypothetical protein